MSLKVVTNVNIDFYNKKYIIINAKRYDKGSRYVLFNCYNHGEVFLLNNAKHSAYIRYNKSDNQAVFNTCTINEDGTILAELTEQMLAVDGICYADLLIVEKGNASVDISTGEINNINNSAILSTMLLCIDVTETPVENSTIESSYEFNGLNSLLEKAEAEYSEVIKLAKSYAMGNAGGIRPSEDTDNSKYYYEQSLINSNNAHTSEQNALNSATKAEASELNAKASEDKARESETRAKASEMNALSSKQSAFESEKKAKESENNAKTSESNAKASEQKALASEQKAKSSEGNAKVSEGNAKTSETNALNYSNISKSYAVGEGNVRPNESTDNSKYYYNLTKTIVNGLNSGFIPIGSIMFSELATVEKATGYSYNIKDDFVTDGTFREGAGKSYTAGTNVFYTNDGYWDCFGGSASATATVEEVKQFLNI